MEELSYSVDHLSREVKNSIRTLFYVRGVSKPQILAKSTTLTPEQLEAILEEPDDMGDFRLHRFNHLTRELYTKAEKVLSKITSSDMEDATLAQKTTFIKAATEQMQKMHDTHQINMDQNEDYKLARLLAMGREEARNQLTERFRSLAHVLFGGLSSKDLMREMAFLSDGKVEKAEPDQKDFERGLEVVEERPSSSDGQRTTSAPQRVGAFGGSKKA